MATHPVVQQVVHAFLDETDRHAGGLVTGLYLVGSVALDDFRPEVSDIDFVAVTDEPVGEADLPRLRRAHQRLTQRHRRPSFEGTYVTWADLARDPALAGPRVWVAGGRVHEPGPDRCDPVAWHTLARCGRAERGPAPAEVDVWTDPKALTDWVRRNAAGYWVPWHHRAARLTSRPGLAMLGDWGPVWSVTGVARQHHTLSTGEITSKTDAGRYAREVFDARWHRIVDECLRLRRGLGGPSGYRSRWERRRDALAFTATVLAELT